MSDDQFTSSRSLRVEFVERWFYSRDGLRAAGKLVAPDQVLISSLASRTDQARAIDLAHRMRSGGQR